MYSMSRMNYSVRAFCLPRISGFGLESDQKSVLAQRLHDLVPSHSLAPQVLGDEDPVVDDQARCALRGLLQPGYAQSDQAYQSVDRQESERRHEATGEGGVRPHHSVLDRIGDDQYHHDVEGGHLAQLALAGEAQTCQQRQIHDQAAEDNQPQARQVEIEQVVHYSVFRAPAGPRRGPFQTVGRRQSPCI